MPALPIPPEPLTDGIVTLRPTAERDIPEILIAYQDDERMHEALGLRRPPSGADLGRAAESAGAELAAGLRLRLTITPAGSDHCIGQIALGQLDWENRRGELVMWVAPGVRRRGYGAAGLGLAARWAFGSCGIDRIALVIETSNAAMRDTALKVGAAHEGVLRGYRSARKGRVDVDLYSLLPADFAA